VKMMVIIQAELEIRKLHYVMIKVLELYVNNKILSPGQALPQHNGTNRKIIIGHARSLLMARFVIEHVALSASVGSILKQ